MTNNFAVFIISHGRAETQLTLKALRNANYSGDIYIVIDNTDEMQELYKRTYGDMIVVFDKEKSYIDSDTIDNFHNLSSAVYARNYCFELAEKLDIEYFLMADDDINGFKFRYDDCGKLKSKDIKSIDKVLEKMIEFIEITQNIVCVAFGNEGGYIGGVNGKFSKGYGRTVNQCMLFKTYTETRFLGTQNEDLNICSVYGKTGSLFFEFYGPSISTPSRGSNDGGNSACYKENSMYVNIFYSVICSPSCLKILRHKNDFVLKLDRNAFIPNVISERWKK